MRWNRWKTCPIFRALEIFPAVVHFVMLKEGSEFEFVKLRSFTGLLMTLSVSYRFFIYSLAAFLMH